LPGETHPACTAFVTGEGGLLMTLHYKKLANDAIEPGLPEITEIRETCPGAQTR